MMMCTGSLARGTCQPQVLELDALLFTRKNLIVGFSFRCSLYTAFLFSFGWLAIGRHYLGCLFSLSPAPQPSMIVVVDMAIFLHRNVNTHTPSTIKILLNDTKDAMRVKLLNLANTSISLGINNRGYFTITVPRHVKCIHSTTSIYFTGSQHATCIHFCRIQLSVWIWIHFPQTHTYIVHTYICTDTGD